MEAVLGIGFFEAFGFAEGVLVFGGGEVEGRFAYLNCFHAGEQLCWAAHNNFNDSTSSLHHILH